jgi:hypothetical protein
MEAEEGVEGSKGFLFAGILLVIATAETRDLGVARRPVGIDTRLAATKHHVPCHSANQKGKRMSVNSHNELAIQIT